jgi:hypothetical protein
MTPILPNHLEDADTFIVPNNYQSLTEREKQFQASLWTLNFLLAELAAGLLLLRQMLVQKGVMTEKEDDELATTVLNPANLQKMYENVELAFSEKYQKVRFAADFPDDAAREIEERRRAASNV